MASISDYANLIVPEYIPMGITGLLVGAVAASGALPDAAFWIAAACFAFIIAGYNSYNAIIDRDIDIINKPHRPLPKGAITERDALLIAIACYAVAVLLAFIIGGMFLPLAALTIVLTIAYSNPLIHLKRRFLLGTLSAVVLYTVLGPLLGWSLYPGSAPPIPIIMFLFFLGMPKGIMKDYIDIAGDAYHRVRSLPVQMGYYGSILIVLLLYLLSAIFLGFLAYEGIIPANFLVLLAVYPFMLWNVYCLPKRFDSQARGDFVFINAMWMLILIEIAIVALIVYKVNIPELDMLVGLVK